MITRELEKERREHKQLSEQVATYLQSSTAGLRQLIVSMTMYCCKPFLQYGYYMRNWILKPEVLMCFRTCIFCYGTCTM